MADPNNTSENPWPTLAIRPQVRPDTPHPVIVEMPEHNSAHLGGTMRLGKCKTVFHGANSVLWSLYGDVESVEERHRHRYEVNPDHIEGGMRGSGKSNLGGGFLLPAEKPRGGWLTTDIEST
jgi:CTP synthase (UTP-ammonia lyase)